MAQRPRTARLSPYHRVREEKHHKGAQRKHPKRPKLNGTLLPLWREVLKLLRNLQYGTRQVRQHIKLQDDAIVIFKR